MDKLSSLGCPCVMRYLNIESIFKISCSNYLFSGSEEDSLWRSSAITKRVSLNTVTTLSGTTYHLNGSLEKSLMKTYMKRDGDLPIRSKVISQFFNGFPPNWAELVIELCLQARLNA